METGTATLRNYRQSPRKVRLLAGLVKGKETKDALALLRFAEKRAAAPVAKLIESALANVRNAGAGPKDIFRVFNLTVDQGVVLKRSMPRARGRAFPIKKRTSHITVTIVRSEDLPKLPAKKEVKKEEKAAPIQKSEEKNAPKAAVKKTPAKKAAPKKKAE